MKKIFFALAMIGSLIVPTNQLLADASFEITEIYAGVTGEDGSEDWFEITNLGTMPGDTGTLFYDDESADPTVNAALTSFVLAPGESAVFLIDSGQSDIDAFNAIWPGVANVGTTSDGGGLSSGGGDSVFVFDGNMAGANIIDSVAFAADDFDNLMVGMDIYATIQATPGGATFGSSLADGQSLEFFNDNLGSSDNLISLAGSPGSFTAIPEPTSVWLLSLGLCVTARRRR